MATHLHAPKKTEKRKKLTMTDKRINTMNARFSFTKSEHHICYCDFYSCHILWFIKIKNRRL